MEENSNSNMFCLSCWFKNFPFAWQDNAPNKPGFLHTLSHRACAQTRTRVDEEFKLVLSICLKLSCAFLVYTLIVKVDWKFLPFFSLDGRAIVLPLQEFLRKCREFAESFKNLCSNKSIYRKKYIDRQFTTGEIMRPTRRRRSQACQTWFLLLLFTHPIVEFSSLLSEQEQILSLA